MNDKNIPKLYQIVLQKSNNNMYIFRLTCISFAYHQVYLLQCFQSLYNWWKSYEVAQGWTELIGLSFQSQLWTKLASLVQNCPVVCKSSEILVHKNHLASEAFSGTDSIPLPTLIFIMELMLEKAVLSLAIHWE